MADKLFSLSAVHTVLRNNTEEDDNTARKYIASLVPRPSYEKIDFFVGGSGHETSI